MDGEQASTAEQDARYQRAAAAYGPALERLARGYEADADLRRDLLQEIHIALWRSYAGFDGRCAERTWIYRVAHNTGVSHMLRRRRARPGALASLEELAERPDPGQPNPETQLGERQALDILRRLIAALKPTDRQIVLLYLEGLDGAAIGEVCGLTSGAVATKLHRLKALLAQRFRGVSHAD
ncbi:RNA polymerase sigma factor [Caulobacter sp. KR2-114]|uniref:RNA polymerase sigma factor n=1 Tax=Caulobacter sp. KR2-114 TaxID=3400912 RepID=UPI003C09516E